MLIENIAEEVGNIYFSMLHINQVSLTIQPTLVFHFILFCFILFHFLVNGDKLWD